MSTERQIDRLDRLTNSVNGNPRYRVHFTDGSSALTQSDAGFCYAINNPEFRGVPVLVEFSRAGRITDVRPAANVASPYVTCPDHGDQSYHKSTGDCSCGSRHSGWATASVSR